MAPTTSILLWDFNRVGGEHYSRIITFPSNKSVTNDYFKLNSDLKNNLLINHVEHVRGSELNYPTFNPCFEHYLIT